MEAKERSKLRGLSFCTMLPGSYEKRFVRELVSKPSGYELSPNQKRMLDVLYWRYRGQINSLIERGRNFVYPTEPQEIVIEEAGEQIETMTRSDEAAALKKAERLKKELDKLDKWNKAVKGSE